MTTPLENVKRAVDFKPFGDAVGNLSLGRGMIGTRAVHVALVENRIASGSLGIAECAKLATLFRIAAKDGKPLILFLDSAGARVSQGLPALGAFRTMFRAALELAVSQTPVVTVLGSNCYGGASMLAHLGRLRIFAPGTQLAMSGPSILAQAAGTSALDEMFRAIAQTSISAEARTKVSAQNRLAGKLEEQIAVALLAAAPDSRTHHDELGRRLGKLRESLATPAQAVQRRDLGKVFADGYVLHEADGVVAGKGKLNGADVQILGVIGGKTTIGVTRAWHLADLAWNAKRDLPVVLLLDSDSHSARIDDEKLVLSEYLMNLTLALNALKPLKTIVLGKAGGGVYVTFASVVAQLEMVMGSQIQVLPGAAIASILGESSDVAVEFPEYLAAGVAEVELKLGLVDI